MPEVDFDKVNLTEQVEKEIKPKGEKKTRKKSSKKTTKAKVKIVEESILPESNDIIIRLDHIENQIQLLINNVNAEFRLDANEMNAFILWIQKLDPDQYPEEKPVITRIQKYKRPALTKETLSLYQLYLNEKKQGEQDVSIS
jgi:hypothetical protein